MMMTTLMVLVVIFHIISLARFIFFLILSYHDIQLQIDIDIHTRIYNEKHVFRCFLSFDKHLSFYPTTIKIYILVTIIINIINVQVSVQTNNKIKKTSFI